MTLRFASLALMLLAACVAEPAFRGPPVPEPAEDSCDARPHGGRIGEPAAALEKVLILGRVRVIRPDTPVTMDFVPERINFDLDGADVIRRIWCG